MGREGRKARHVLWNWWPPWGSIQRGPAEEQHRQHLRTVHQASEQRASIHQYQSYGSRVTPAGLTRPHFQTIMLESRYKQEGTRCGEQLSQPVRSWLPWQWLSKGWWARRMGEAPREGSDPHSFNKYSLSPLCQALC